MPRSVRTIRGRGWDKWFGGGGVWGGGWGGVLLGGGGGLWGVECVGFLRAGCATVRAIWRPASLRPTITPVRGGGWVLWIWLKIGTWMRWMRGFRRGSGGDFFC